MNLADFMPFPPVSYSRVILRVYSYNRRIGRIITVLVKIFRIFWIVAEEIPKRGSESLQTETLDFNFCIPKNKRLNIASSDFLKHIPGGGDLRQSKKRVKPQKNVLFTS
jgi:hypothetical protein